MDESELKPQTFTLSNLGWLEFEGVWNGPISEPFQKDDCCLVLRYANIPYQSSGKTYFYNGKGREKYPKEALKAPKSNPKL